MTRFVAFLRAINVGGHTVKMEPLRALFEALDLQNVATFIASGNVVFSVDARAARDRPKLERRIEGHLFDAFGYSVETFLRTDDELAAVTTLKGVPHLEPAPGDSLYVGFLGVPASADAKQATRALGNERDEFVIHGQEVYWFTRGRFSESKVTGKHLERALGQATTLRNITSVRKLVAKFPPLA
jgi:uncharacterized protein (DUF1697 family)